MSSYPHSRDAVTIKLYFKNDVGLLVERGVPTKEYTNTNSTTDDGAMYVYSAILRQQPHLRSTRAPTPALAAAAAATTTSAATTTTSTLPTSGSGSGSGCNRLRRPEVVRPARALRGRGRGWYPSAAHFLLAYEHH